MDIIGQLPTEVKGSVHTATVTLPTRKDWTRAARAAAVKERIAPGRWSVQSSRHAHVFYSVDTTARTCNCPAGSFGRDCHHLLWAEEREGQIAWAAERERGALLRAELRRLRATYGDGLWFLAVEEVELDPPTESRR